MGAQPSVAAASWGEGDGTGAAALASVTLLAVQPVVVAGDSIFSTAIQTSFASSQQTIIGFAVGDVFRVTARGVWGTGNAGVTLEVLLVGNGTTLATNGATLHAANITNAGWYLNADITVVAIGASGQLEAQGYRMKNTTAAAGTLEDLQNVSPVSPINLSASLSFSLDAIWGAADASNTITMRSFTLERLRMV